MNEVIFLLKAQMKSVTVNFPAKNLFEGISLEVHDKDRIGILGRNGSGKTTIFNILLGDLTPDEGYGKIHVPYGHLQQQASLEESTLKKLLENSGTYDKRVLKLMEAFAMKEMLHTPFQHLSGGEKTKLSFINAVKEMPPLLLLDEPTNFLDVESIKAMEEFLRDYNGAVLLISHDREFLDTSVSKIYHLEKGKLKRYTGNYTAFKKKREEDLARENMEYIEYTRKRKALEAAAQGISQKANRLEGLSQNDYLRGRNKQLQKKAKSMRKRVEMLEVKERPTSEKEVKLSFLTPEDKTPPVLLRGENLGKSFDRVLFKDISLEIRRADKIGLLGENGAGKTTLMKILLGELSHEGTVTISPSVKLGYLSQDLTGLREEETPLEFLLPLHPVESDIRNFLGGLKIKGDSVFLPIKHLSYGEKLRVSLLRILLTKCALLILDEPTNFLDLETKEVFEEALRDYEGAMLLITHDRYFMKNVAKEIWHLKDKQLTRFPGTLTEYLERDDKPKTEETILLLKMRQAELSHRMLMARKEELRALEDEFFSLSKDIKSMENK
jgi:ATPase subunit of ABC transporter with duplicated ATPase domains